MSVSEDVARLTIETVGQNDLKAATDLCNRALEDFQRQLKAGAITFEQFERGTDEVTERLGRLRDQQLEHAAATKKWAGDIKTLSRDGGAAISKAGADVGRAALEGSRALEDLQYGIGGVVNNIPSLVMALGGTAGLTAAISLGAIGVAQLVKHWKDLTGIFEEKTTLAKASGDLNDMGIELANVRDRMKELDKQSSVTLAQFKEYNDLREKTAMLEKQIADEQERQARVKGLLGLKDPEKEAAEKARADALKPAFGDPEQKQLIDAVKKASKEDPALSAGMKALRQSQMDAIAELVNARQADPLNVSGLQTNAKNKIEEIKRQIIAEQRQMDKDVEQLVADAVIGGKEDAVNKIGELMEQQVEKFTEKQRAAFEAVLSNGKLARKAFAARLGLDENGQPLERKGAAAEPAGDLNRQVEVLARGGLGGGHGAGGGGGAGGFGAGPRGPGGAAFPGGAPAAPFAPTEPGPPPAWMGKGAKLSPLERRHLKAEKNRQLKAAKIAAETQRQQANRAARAARAQARNANKRVSRRANLPANDIGHASAPGPQQGRAIDALNAAMRGEIPGPALPIQARPKFEEFLRPEEMAPAHAAAAGPPQAVRALDATQQAMGQVQNVQSAMGNRLDRLEVRANRMEAEARRQNARNRQPGPTNLDMGTQ